MKVKRSCGSVAFHEHRKQQTKLLEKKNSCSFLVCVDSTLLATLLSLGSVFFHLVLEAFSRTNGLFPLWQLNHVAFLSVWAGSRGWGGSISAVFLEVNSGRITGASFPRLVLTFFCQSVMWLAGFSARDPKPLLFATSFCISVSVTSAVLLYLCTQAFLFLCSIWKRLNFLFFLAFHGNLVFFQIWREPPHQKKKPTVASSFKKYLGYLPFSHLDHEKYSEIPIPTLIWHITSQSYCSPWHRCLGGVIALNCLLSAEDCIM